MNRSDDTISRKAAIDALGDIHPLDYNLQAVLEKIKALPSAKDIDVSNKVRKVNRMSDLISRQSAIDAEDSK